MDVSQTRSPQVLEQEKGGMQTIRSETKDSRKEEKRKKQEEKFLKEEARIQGMKKYENVLYEKGIFLVAGIDEVGRGPLAGPVVACAVILPPQCHIHGINDSKKLSEKKREVLYDLILQEAVGYGIGIVDHRVIDEINILNATKLAMKQAVEELSLTVKPQHLLIDALKLEQVAAEQTSIIGGDGKSLSVAAASIVAKVTRDRMMEEFDRLYPGYDFKSNKGYGTKSHYAGIEANGICPIHRKSFLKRILAQE